MDFLRNLPPERKRSHKHAGRWPTGQLPRGLTDAVRKPHGLHGFLGFRPSQGWSCQAQAGYAVQLVAQPILLKHCTEAETI